MVMQTRTYKLIKVLIIIFLLSLGGCDTHSNVTPVGDSDTKPFRGKVIYQVIPSEKNEQVTIIFTDSSSVYIYSDCWMYLKQQK